MGEAAGPSFDWGRQWYPVSVAKHLDKRLPQKVTLLSEHFVLWWDKQHQAWKAAKDQCPHRLAPLSEGRFTEEGHLQCTYHGWHFDGDGKCRGIPQIEEVSKCSALDNPRAHLEVVPCQLKQGILWIFPDSTAEGREASQSVQPATVPELDDGPPGLVASRDTGLKRTIVHYNWDTLIENLVDPSHVPWAHHGIQGDRKKSRPIPLQRASKLETGGFTVSSKATLGQLRSGDPVEIDNTIRFKPPCLVMYAFNLAGVGKMLREKFIVRLLCSLGLGPRVAALDTDGRNMFYLILYAIPIEPGKSMVLSRFPRSTGKTSRPEWHDHLERMAVLDGDSIHLHWQERMMRLKPDGVRLFEQSYYMPAQADLAVRLFRNWLGNYGGGQPSWLQGSGELPPLQRDRRMILDRWLNHTKDCPYCRTAFCVFKSLRIVSTALAVCLPFTALGVMLTQTLLAPKERGRAVSLSGWLCAVASVGGVAAPLLASVEQRYVFIDYVHALRK
ncbi:unnamed protein product [Vitrella brassicaformis CCMP3155]|uniref:Rieske domain-containing protein n=1 Tax=Vitrella brassicaformis (strain CCMP3155) TaxID=1169540 RepID=A0A0G4GDT7_VITBC|nr:unnamed protein product [Vitrella brassicaformis CCMP3155]|mmetsp:Transcript_24440/g.60347  ORF Transcript_24440/g.60347 Transcript_24440/m.60347 type:complete len:500 (-) Transcript_24440:14-1513(-)|eukprot:CEM27529.1 unnamed protein product [Vitrella brassicaformis CCMP3155]